MANLSWGSRGAEVTQAQLALQKAGFDPGPIDGIFGAMTDAATRRFQTARRLKVDGIIGPETSAALALPAPGAPAPTLGVDPLTPVAKPFNWKLWGTLAGLIAVGYLATGSRRKKFF